MSPLHTSLVYTSRATDALTDPELEVILIRGRTLNAMRGITGVLVKNGALLCQYLEGERHAIERTFDSIRRNNLHVDVQLVGECADIKRVFDCTHHAFVGMQHQNQRNLETQAWSVDLERIRSQAAVNPPLLHLISVWDAWPKS